MAAINICSHDISLPYGSVKKKEVLDLAQRVADFLGLEESAFTIILTGDRYIRDINRRFRDRDSATDVISFCNREEPFPAVGEGAEDLGEIYISLETAETQAGEYGVSPTQEIARLIVHGILHLVGYDHEKSEKERVKMEKIEDALLASLFPE